MTIIRYNAPSKHVLIVDNNECHGGETLDVTPEQAEELLTAPYADVSIVDGEASDHTGESQTDPALVQEPYDQED